MNVAKKKRWLRGDELLESRDIYLKEEFPQRPILSCICPIAVTYLTLFFIYTCIYLHTYIHITTHHITSHHITRALPYRMFQELFAVWETFWVSSCPCFSLLLATHWMFHLSFCEVFPSVSTVFDIGFLVLRSICGILEHGRWILHFGTSTCRLPRYLRHVTPKITQTIVVFLLFLHVLAILCCCGCGYRACVFLVVLVVLAALAALVVLVVLWLLLCLWLWLWFRLQLRLVKRKYKPNQTESLRCHAYIFFRPENRVYPTAN